MAKGVQACAGLTALLMIAGCGGDDSEATDSAKRFSGEERDVAQVIEEYEKAIRDEDIDKVCGELISQRVVKEAEQSGRRCRDGAIDLRTELDRYGGPDELDVDAVSVQVSGDTARARIRYSGGGKSRTETLALLQEDDGWAVGLRNPGR